MNGRLSLRLPPALKRKAAVLARKDMCSVALVVRDAMDHYTRYREDPNGRGFLSRREAAERALAQPQKEHATP